MNTVIFLWNPAISDFSISDMTASIKRLNAPWWESEPNTLVRGQWAVWDYQNCHRGDRCFLMRVGDKHAGLVMSGWIDGEPFSGKNWNGDGSKRHYVQFIPDCYLDNEQLPYISLAELEKQFPKFEWSGGHSGRILPHRYAGKLELIWLQYLYNNRILFNQSPYFGNYCAKFEINEIANQYLQRTRGAKCEICGHDYQHLFGKDVALKHDYSFVLPLDVAEPSTRYDNSWRHIYCICDCCRSVGEEKFRMKLWK